MSSEDSSNQKVLNIIFSISIIILFAIELRSFNIPNIPEIIMGIILIIFFALLLSVPFLLVGELYMKKIK